MKKLMIIILGLGLWMNISAQNKFTKLFTEADSVTAFWETETIHFSDKYLKTGKVTFDSAFIQPFVEDALISKLIEYRTECYNDSTTILVNVNPDRNVSRNGFTTCVYYPPVWKDKWIHKEPTLADFINWIERKYLKQN